MRKYIKHRPWNFYAVIFGVVGFWLQYKAFARLESIFGQESMAFGFRPEQMTWLQTHYGTLSVLCLATAAALYVKDHHNETRNR